MSAIYLLLDPEMLPFTGALLLVAGFLFVELLMSLLGGSLMGDAADSADLDGVEFDGPEFDTPEFDGPDLEGVELDGPGAEGPELDGADMDGTAVASAGGLAAWLGFGQVPFILWLAGLLTAFGLVGYGVQIAAKAALGGPLGWPIAVAIALVPSLRIGGLFARTLGRLVPKTESSAINRRSLGGRRGVVVQGTARRGKPAQARVTDGYGNWHYVRIEPVDDHVAIPARTEVMIRDGRGPILFAIPLDDISD